MKKLWQNHSSFGQTGSKKRAAEMEQNIKDVYEPEKKEGTAGIAGKRWLTKGSYRSGDVPVRILDGVILGALAVLMLLIVMFTVNGGYTISFDTGGGSAVASQRLRYGKTVEEPDIPQKAGYEFQGWLTSLDLTAAKHWDFSQDEVEGDLVLYAVWRPAEITVKFDLDGGSYEGKPEAPALAVTFGEPYGPLPVPAKAGCTFKGWQYSGMDIGSDTVVNTSGEHVLTALWQNQ